MSEKTQQSDYASTTQETKDGSTMSEVIVPALIFVVVMTVALGLLIAGLNALESV